MYKSILVPLDGSHCAEGALHYAVELAKASQSVIHLVTVMPVIPGHKAAIVQLYPLQIECQDLSTHMVRHLKQEMLSYLDMTAWDIEEEGIKTVTNVSAGDPAEQILQYIIDHDIDLLVLSAHGLGGSKHWPYGGITFKVLQRSPIPVLLIKNDAQEDDLSMKVTTEEIIYDRVQSSV